MISGAISSLPSLSAVGRLVRQLPASGDHVAADAGRAAGYVAATVVVAVLGVVLLVRGIIGVNKRSPGRRAGFVVMIVLGAVLLLGVLGSAANRSG